MPTTLLVVKVTIPPQQETAFNAWYSGEHAPQSERVGFAYTQVWP